jgi:meckelin
MRLTMNICAALPLLLYVFLVGISWYYLIFYKIQGILFIIVPYFPSDVSYFNLAVVATAGLEILHITRSIYKQCTAELFFVDWEQAKALNQESPESTKKVNVSIWRSIFMSNEWAKLQVFRKCDVQFTLIGVLVFSKVFNLRYLGTAKPDLEDLTPGQMSSILLFAADSLCWIIMIGIQRIYGFFFYERYYRNRLNQFVDILSLSNISLLVFDEYCHGYYIHGRSVHSTADTDMEELNNCLQREAADMVPRRGFADTNQQSFEIFVPKPFREFFDKIYRPSEGETTRRMVMMNRLTFTNGRSNPKESAVNTGLVKTYKAMNKFLRSFFESVSLIN